jgi:hypothetical protein
MTYDIPGKVRRANPELLGQVNAALKVEQARAGERTVI